MSGMNNVVKSLLNIRCREGATLNDIANDYLEFCGKPWPFADKSPYEIFEYMNSIGAVYSKNDKNDIRWYIKSENSEHISTFLREQKNPEKKNIHEKTYSNQKLNRISDRSTFFFDDNSLYMKNRDMHVQPKCNGFRKNDSIQNKPTKNIMKIETNLNFIGDEFLLNFLLHKKSSKHFSNVRYGNLCTSGLSIQEASNMIENAIIPKKSNLIINLGSNDVLQGRTLTQMSNDFKQLISICNWNDIRPILITIAPLANQLRSPKLRKIVAAFNCFLLDNYIGQYEIIDIWSDMVTPTGHLSFNLFNMEAMYGSKKSAVLWSSKAYELISYSIGSVVRSSIKKQKSSKKS